MASSAQNQHHQFPNVYGGATSAPPPTPSAQPGNLLSTSDAADTLSRFLNRLTPTLSLPSRRSQSQTISTTSPPIISFSDRTASGVLDELCSSSSQLGFFQLTNHCVPSELANSAESEALSIFNLPRDQKESCFPKNWPLGYDGENDEDDDEEGDGLGESFCLDASCSSESAELSFSLDHLCEFTRAMEKLGLEIIECLSSSVGFENPLGKDPTRFRSFMWISEGLPGNKLVIPGEYYPYVVGLQYQIRSQKYSLLADSGWVSVLPQLDSVLVTIGDIAQVWSNGKLKKVRGRPVMACLGESKNCSRSISMSVLVSLPLESRVGPLLLPKASGISGSGIRESNDNGNENVGVGDDDDDDEKEEKLVFNSFCLEDYAWKVSHERLPLRDPLERYRIR
ncbi:hypothetical protein FEM48_Zijuj03G0107100 [Ziziphus jujuba var. spinosa]|uniref:Gibberellin 2-beta-dioxygenase 1 n=1 Tax=Ziziphus jujuba var. spinosa TaxID=714518 RepID=A0A978VPU6_ZIZJJ|nr:hypothetical protein FEM48_Zijuj03G0107100 [Ziziphus jujuba var. spinosa]